MNVLILTCSTGGGHNSAAGAIAKEMGKRGIPHRIKNALEFVPRPKQEILEKGHSFLYRHAPNVFGKAYEKAEQFEKHSAMYYDYALHAPSIAKYIKRQKFDVVICVHEFPALMLTAARKHFSLNVKLYFVVTDYTFSPGLEETELDAFFIPFGFSELYKNKGLPEERLVETGIPVDVSCYNHPLKSDIRNALCIREDKTLILIAAGSIGCGPIEEIVDEVIKKRDKDTVIAVLCGKNKSLLRELTAKVKDASLIPMGFIDNVIDWIAAADVFVTKAGGLSTTEAATVGIPIVLMNAVPGLEIHNLKYFVNNGCACTAKTVSGICDAIEAAIINADEYISNQRCLFSSNSVQEIVNYVLSDSR